MEVVRLPRLGTFEAWRATARRLAAQNVPDDGVTWALEGGESGLFDGLGPAHLDVSAGAGPGSGPGRDVPARDAPVRNVPRDFPPLARQLCASRTAGAFDLAYRLLLRLGEAPGLLGNRADADVACAEQIAKSIRRDKHKMKAFVRFREVTPQGANRRQFLSWFEPDHRIEELIGEFFARRFGDMDWVIVTPEVTTRFENGEITYEAVTREPMDLSDATEALWKTYYANIFNPARLKIKAMQSEMPKKYWKNLPEAALIPDLIAQAEAKVAQMRANAPTLPPLRAEKIKAQVAMPQGVPKREPPTAG